MARPQALKETKLNGIVLVFLLIAIFGIAWGEFNQVQSGILYFSLMFAGIGVISLIREFKNEDNKKDLKNLFKTPFLQSTLLASAMYLAGFFLIIALNLFFGAFTQGFSTVQFLSPLYLSADGGLSSGLSQSFNAGVIENSPFFQWFYGVWTAGTVEEFVFGYALFLALWVISSVILIEAIFGGKAPFGISNRAFNEIFSFGGVILMFGGIHLLNGSYEGIMFVYAMVFRLLMSLAIFKFGLGLAFTIGIHHSNNNMAFVQTQGIGTLIEVLFTNWFGLVFVALFLALIVYVFRNIDEVIRLFKKEIGSFRG